MKSLTKNMMLAIAAVAIAAGTVSAQTMKAEIPFAFRAGTQVMQPGQYLVRVLPNYSAPVLTLANQDLKKTVIVMPSNHNAPSMKSASAAPAKLRFECGADGPCTLTRLWTGDGYDYGFHSNRAKDGDMRIAEISLRPERAD